MLVGVRLFAFLPTRSVFQRVVVVLDARKKQLFSPTPRVVIVVVVVVVVIITPVSFSCFAAAVCFLDSLAPR